MEGTWSETWSKTWRGHGGKHGVKHGALKQGEGNEERCWRMMIFVILTISHSSPSSSTLNPKAPMFVPSAYRAVEDFSDQWWALVESSPWFRDYWLQECFCDSQNATPSSEIYDPFFSDIDALLDDPHSTKEEEEEEKEGNETQNGNSVVRRGVFKWRKQRVTAPRYSDKAPKIVNVKLSPRPIQQPR